MYFEESLECMTRPALEKLQVERLRRTLAQARHAPAYQRSAALNLDIRSTEQLGELVKELQHSRS